MPQTHTDPSLRTIYTPAQITAYLTRIALPAKYLSSPILAAPSPNNPVANTAEGLIILGKLIRYQLAAVPFENLELHYSTHHTVTLDPGHLFHKIVERGHGRGGYCMENTCLLGTVLRSLGYHVMSTGARVNEAVQPISAAPTWAGPRFDGWNHMVNIVTIASIPYLVDVGFGSNSPTFPVPLTPDYTSLNILPAHTMRLTRGPIPDNTSAKAANPTQDLWLYSIRFAATSPWLPAYCFSEIEFLPRDFETMSFFVSQSRTSWFTLHVVCLIYLMDRESEEMVGDITLFGTDIKERRSGKSEVLMPITCEEERVVAMEKFLGIVLSAPERGGIKGLITDLG